MPSPQYFISDDPDYNMYGPHAEYEEDPEWEEVERPDDWRERFFS